MASASRSAGDGSVADISGFVLAGGRSSRLGQDKALLPWNGGTLLEHAVGRLQQACGKVQVCADRDDLNTHGILIRDAQSGAGPLGAIVAALERSQTEWNFFLAVDLPLVPVEFLRALAARIPNNFAACILPQIERLPQPLCGLYHCSLMTGLRRALQEGKYRIMQALQQTVEQDQQPARHLELWDVREFSACAGLPLASEASDWFLNINTAEDWQQARKLQSNP